MPKNYLFLIFINNQTRVVLNIKKILFKNQVKNGECLYKEKNYEIEKDLFPKLLLQHFRYYQIVEEALVITNEYYSAPEAHLLPKI